MTDTSNGGWSELHRRKRVAWLTAGACIPVVVAVLWLRSQATPWLCLACAVAVAITIERVTSCPCPRCEKRLFRQGLFHNTFSKTCLHCGLAVDSTLPKGTAETSAV